MTGRQDDGTARMSAMGASGQIDATHNPGILIVDDDEANRELLAAWLRGAGYVVHEATHGEQALTLLNGSRVDLVLLDVNLPDMSGIDVCRRIKSTRATSAIPVMHVTATAVEDNQRSAGLTAGADGYLIEPVSRDVLLASVLSMLRLYEPRRAAEHLAARLEQLHQATLLMNAAPTVRELMYFASTGLSGLFAVTSVVLFAPESGALLAEAAPNEPEPRIVPCEATEVLRVAEQVTRAEIVDLSILRRHLGWRAVAGGYGAPITTPSGHVVGAVLLLTDQRRTEDELMLDHFAQAFAVALENQRLYDVEHQIALTLQQSMLPQTLPHRPLLDVAVRYRAASDTVEIGGDFYEVIALDEQRTLVAIGDVMGHSLRAATIMAELRYSLRAFASIGLSAVETLQRLDRILYDHTPTVTATVCLAEVDTASHRLLVTNAGHLPPVVQRAASGEREQITEHGLLLGAGAPDSLETRAVPFEVGDLLILATDGLLERRGETVDAGLDRLMSAPLAGNDDIDDIIDALLAFVGDPQQAFDDVAAVVVRFAAREADEDGLDGEGVGHIRGAQ